jgi:subtilisin family serine protease
MASPQVCGVGALLLQLYPHATPEQLKNLIVNNCTTDILYSTGLDNDYTDERSLRGGTNKLLFNSFSNDVAVTMTGNITLSNINFR